MLACFRFWLFSTAFILCLYPLSAQQAPLTEMRGCWIVTLNNIDWPSKPGLPPERQRMEFDSLLDALKATGINAVFVQIRPAGDAFYPTPSAPWSRFLTGQEGIPPLPEYDPVEYMVQAAHKRNMEFHAWMNPFRATPSLDTASLAASHPMKMLPEHRVREWFFPYGTRYYFNPGSPFVKQYIVGLVREVVTRYDVDGIHFDDYFYPYKEQGWELNDFDAFAADPRGFQYIDDWRRDNINRIVEAISKEIRQLKPYVQFGISPFGVWRNRDKDPNGSETNAGMTSYDDLYADVRLWLEKGWIDYVTPQLYWSIGFPAADYYKLSDWWGRNSFGRKVYTGHAAYKVGSSAVGDAAWNDPAQIRNQVQINRAVPGVQGSIYFSANALLRNPLGVRDSLRNNLYALPAVVPPAAGATMVAAATPRICRVKGEKNSVKLAWQVCNIASGGEMPYYYTLHRFPGSGVGDINDRRYALHITEYNDNTWIFEDKDVAPKEIYTYVLVAYNRANMPGYPSEPVVVKKTKKSAKRKK
ncbi:MAG: family 10 glycosylhydrolase [Saprospiraceae bacterium]|nr:family 10 glycosylhydrolase [Saprospiraceae bacterium]